MPAQAHDESEYRTRRQRIDPMLEAQGWQGVPFDPARPLGQYAHHALTEFPTDNGPADYALIAASQLLGIVEAKNRVFGGELEQMVEALNEAMAA